MTQLKTFFSLALSLFILMNAIGNTTLFLSVLKGIPPKRQKQIVLRELIIALVVIILFNYIGAALLKFLNVTQEILQVAGGIILFLLSLKMLFPSPEQEIKDLEREFKKVIEPFVVPLAIPLVAGPAVLAAVMLYSNQFSDLMMISSIVIAWVASLGILILSPLLSKWLGERGLIAVERLMGFIMVLISLQMFFTGIKTFMRK
jgi:multiple antibiotic resistance protein